MTKLKNSFKFKLFAAVASLVMALSLVAVPVMAADVGDNGQTDASVGFEDDGVLRLVEAPRLNFGGANEITGGIQNLTAQSIDSNIQVSDLRGSNAGWTLNAQLGEFQSGGSTVLQGASIKVTAPTVVNPNGNPEDLKPTVPASIELKAGGPAAVVLDADGELNQGGGIWESNWALANTILNVRPGTAVAGQSVATINWSFQSAP